MVHKEEDIAMVIVRYFNKMFTSQDGDREETVHLALRPIITEEQNNDLIRLPSPHEIRNAAFSIHADKAPGPDGFSASFFHSNWENIGEDIVKEVQGLFSTGVLPEHINDTHILLIPKNKNPQTVADYRPIALCNVYYKIISKIITKRLQPLLSSLISENQSAFVPGRAISYNVLITHEVLHYLKTSKAEKHCSMAVKTDMSKAYDRLEWEFIELVLQRLGFHQVWINLIMQCISTVTYSFLINGSPRGKVSPSRGIRQGDPLSPYIFILCSEVLSGLCNRAQEEGRLQGVRIARGCPRINHLLFADDTMFFLSTNSTCRAALRDILQRYEEASGQTINPEKSAITFSKHTPSDLKQAVKDDLQIQKEGGTGKYLGLPEQFGRKKKDLFASIVDRIKQIASGWSTKFLSTAGKMAMLQSVLSAVPSHSMTCFKLPISLCKRIQSTVTRFWRDKRKMAWIAWEKLAQPKFRGGLGFRDFESFNDALLAKLSWRLTQHPEGLLGRTLFGKYCAAEDFLLCPETDAISHGWRGILIGRNLLLQNLGWVIGDGQDIKIWSDPWLSFVKPERPIGRPPERYTQSTVADLLVTGTTEWNLQEIRRICPAYEQQILSIKPSKKGAKDKMVWLGTKSGEYSTKTGYAVASLSQVDEDDQNNQNMVDFNWNKCVWGLNTAPKIKMFVWKALRIALPVGTRLIE